MINRRIRKHPTHIRDELLKQVRRNLVLEECPTRVDVSRPSVSRTKLKLGPSNETFRERESDVELIEMAQSHCVTGEVNEAPSVEVLESFIFNYDKAGWARSLGTRCKGKGRIELTP